MATDFVHRFVPATVPGRAPLLLLHGTGGNENDLLPLGAAVAPGAALLSPRGQVLENGMPRFFRRLSEGVFDAEDLRHRTDDLAAFIGKARDSRALAAPVALGFSNGANIAASLLLRHPGLLRGAILLRAMVPFRPDDTPRLDGTAALLLSGRADPIVPAANSDMLAELLAQAGATVTHRRLPVGHGLSQADVTLAREWLATL
ncbi:alpha/beta hydrolase [Roseomonas sp. E05]|uniref:alpha/beta hydrolase n=1 Tax=Roseomonas sp. E05 TaxID=3046310 RepID=UPI0024BBDA5E|nr:alpha/beta hydrolase [Roseomonas sp. E05]MDJ0388748.1 alpha/beta hydrolase [Roseomonas sp. E05]